MVSKQLISKSFSNSIVFEVGKVKKNKQASLDGVDAPNSSALIRAVFFSAQTMGTPPFVQQADGATQAHDCVSVENSFSPFLPGSFMI